MNRNLLSKSGFSLDRLAGFCAVADAGSIVGAARDDAVRQSLLSRQIRELEEYFGTELVRRKGRGLVLTDRGTELAAMARSQFASLSDFAATCGNAPVRVTIAAPESLLQWLVLPRIGALQKVSPKVVFVLQHEENAAIASRVQEGLYDFGVVRRQKLTGGEGLVELGKLEDVLIAPKKLLPRQELSLADAMKVLPLAVPLTGTFRKHLDAYLDKQSRSNKVNIVPAMECTSYLQAAGALRSGHFAAFLPSLAAGEFSGEGYGVWPFAALKLERHPISLIWSRRNASTREAVRSLSGEMGRILAF